MKTDSKKYYNTVHYNELSDVHKKKLIKRFSHNKNKDIIDYFDIKCGGKFLDIACGTGRTLQSAFTRGCDCYGVDFSEKALEVAKKRVKATLYCRDVNLGFPDLEDNKFDYITCLGSLEHFVNQDMVLKETVRICKEEGKIIILVPNNDYILHKLGYETDYQPIINRYSLKGWKNLLERNGCKVIKTVKENSHLSIDESSSWIKFLLKLIISPFIRYLPLNLSFNFIFICVPGRERE